MKICKRTIIINYDISSAFGMESENIIMSQHSVEKQVVQIFVDLELAITDFKVYEPVTPGESKLPGSFYDGAVTLPAIYKIFASFSYFELYN